MSIKGDGFLSNGIIQRAGANNSGWVSNIGFTYGSGILTVTNSGGASLNERNPGFLTAPSATAPGLLHSIKVTSGGTIQDADGVSNFTGLSWGETADSTQDILFYIYAVNRANSDIDGEDGSSAFVMSRKEIRQMPSDADDIGDLGQIPVNDSVDVVMILGDVTVANYVDLPLALIKTIRMRFELIPDDWTIQAFSYLDSFSSESLQIDGFASGTTMVFPQASAPLGWVTDTTVNDRFLRSVSTGGGGTGGTWDDLDHDHTVDSHNHDAGTLAACLFQDNTDFDMHWREVSSPSWTNNQTSNDGHSSTVAATRTSGIDVVGFSGNESPGTSEASLGHDAGSHQYLNTLVCVKS